MIYRVFAFCLFIVAMISCQPYGLQQKQASGIYRVNFQGFEDRFTEEEKLFYGGVRLELNYEGTFAFSKAIHKNSKLGTWWLHDSVEFDWITLKYSDGTTLEISRCASDSCLTKVKIYGDDEVKYLPFIKIKHDFPELLED